MKLTTYQFQRAVPIWEKGTATRMNHTVSFVCAFRAEAGRHYTLHLAASTVYLLIVNGSFMSWGPARAGHGYYRVDELSLDAHILPGDNVLAVRVCGYNVNSYDTLDVPAFVCAELTEGGAVIAHTAAGEGGFAGYACPERVEKTHRYSFQRPFSEAYRLCEGAFSYEAGQGGCPVEIEATEPKQFIRREVPYGDFEVLRPVRTLGRGSVTYGGQDTYDDRSLVPIPAFKTYPRSELDYDPAAIVSTFEYHPQGATAEGVDEIFLPADSYIDLDLGCNQTGIFALELESQGGELFLTWDETLTKGQVNCRRMRDITNFISVRAMPGRHRLICTEPYVMRYIRLVAKGSAMTVRDLRLYQVAFPASQITARFVGDDPMLESIYRAAVATFAANTVDIYMDCPSRERAGWLCDSFFTSRVERVLTGQSRVERAFLQNFLMPARFEHLPEGMLPMCYPADHNDRVFIPNWAMWYVCEFEEYMARTGDRELLEGARARILSLLEYFRKKENSDGLLESLDSWVFVEWSHANDLTQDVNYPTNMLYAKFKSAIARLYDLPALEAEAAALRQTVAEQSFTGQFFCDNAHRREGKLVLSGECTEVCQYYAFFCGVATPESHPALWETLRRDFGYWRRQTGKYPEIAHANAFIGNYLRLELLDRYGYAEDLLDNIRGYFAGMAETTGTLWEHDSPWASCNHGFASHVIYWMARQGLVK